MELTNEEKAVITKCYNFPTLFQMQYTEFKRHKNTLEYTEQGSKFQVDLPEIKTKADGSFKTVTRLRHDKDKATMTLRFDKDARLIGSPKLEYEMHQAGPAEAPIPEWGMEIIDGGLAIISISIGTGIGIVVGFASATVTGPGGIAIGVVSGLAADIVLEGIAKAIMWGIGYANDQATKEEVLDKNGSMYFRDVVSHSINRTVSAIQSCWYGISESEIDFNYSRFLQTLSPQSPTWNDKDKNAVKYKHANLDFRTWMPEFSTIYDNRGMLVSCTIDAIRSGGPQDDRVTVDVTYDGTGKVVVANAVIGMDDEPNVDSGYIVLEQSGKVQRLTSDGKISHFPPNQDFKTVEQALVFSIDEALQASNNYSRFPAQRKALPGVLRLNLEAMGNAFTTNSRK